MLTPVALLSSLAVALLSVFFLGIGIWLLWRAARRWRNSQSLVRVSNDHPSQRAERNGGTRESGSTPDPLIDPAFLAPLIAGAALVLFALAGRHVVQLVFPAGPDEPSAMRTGTMRELRGNGGSTIHTETYGPSNAPTLILSHGWGTNSTEWYYAKKHLAGRFRIILWDNPGLGESSQPENRDYTLSRQAADLRTVLSLAEGKPVILVGHSIGGMINLTFCRMFPELIPGQVAGIVQLDTSYTNPVKTTKNSETNLALQKPVGEPVLHAMVALSPLVRVLNWFSYHSGMSHLMNAQSSFAGSETRGQLDLVSRYQYESTPSVVARGTLAMFHWDATPVLPRVQAPVLIIVGQQDTTTLPSASETMHNAMPNSELQYINPGAHYALLEQNEKVDSAIAQFASAHVK